MKIAVFGSNGQIGKFLKDKLRDTSYELIFTERKDVDITNKDKINNFISDVRPGLIINSAAYTKVDDAEENKELAKLCNHTALTNISSACVKYNCKLIHLSTDYVFNGKLIGEYRENDHTDPLSYYGKTKLGGEKAIIKSGCSYIIIRTSWVFSEYGKNFLKTILNLAHSRERLSIVDDQIGGPTYAQDIASAITKIIPIFISNNQNGIFHFAGSPYCSWADFAESIFEEAYKKKKIIKKPKILRIKSDELKSIAARPLNSKLNSDLIFEHFNIQPSDWKNAVKVIMKRKNEIC